MLTPDGPKVIEYNCRFGDPETQVVLPLLESDLLTVMQATTNGTLADTEVRFSDEYACCVITASAGYPVSYKKGFEITMTPEAAAHTYVAGAKLENGKLLTSGGRVTGTTAVADSAGRRRAGKPTRLRETACNLKTHLPQQRHRPRDRR